MASLALDIIFPTTRRYSFLSNKHPKTQVLVLEFKAQAPFGLYKMSDSKILKNYLYLFSLKFSVVLISMHTCTYRKREHKTKFSFN